MKKEDLLSEDFIKQFKDPQDFTNFMSELYQQGIERISSNTKKRSPFTGEEDVQQLNYLQWQKRPLKESYKVVWVDHIKFKVREHTKINNKQICIAIGLNENKERTILGIWPTEIRGTKPWNKIFSEINRRGVTKISHILSNDDVNISEAVKEVFPETKTAHSFILKTKLAYQAIPMEDKKELSNDLKVFFCSPTTEIALDLLNKFVDKWKYAYPDITSVVEEGRAYIDELCQVSQNIRSIVCDLNIGKEISEATQQFSTSKLAYLSEKTAMNSMYSGVIELSKKWS